MFPSTETLDGQILSIFSQADDQQQLVSALVSFIHAREEALRANLFGVRKDVGRLLTLPSSSNLMVAENALEREKYEERLNRKESPLEFLGRVWPEYRKGQLYQFQLRKKDKKLFIAVRNWAQRNDKKIIDILPPKSVYLDRWLHNNPEAAKEVVRIYHAICRRKAKKRMKL